MGNMSPRSLTSGEVALARSVFADAIDYSRVRLVHGKWWPFQPRRSAMAPMGNIYFHPDGGGWSEDFSKEPLHAQGYFIHELTHVWQAQRGGRFYLPLARHPFCRYGYEIVPGRPFGRYGLEQQAEIVRHAFLLSNGARPGGSAPLDRLRGLLPWLQDANMSS
jgi:hypothetical protein